MDTLKEMNENLQKLVGKKVVEAQLNSDIGIIVEFDDGTQLVTDWYAGEGGFVIIEKRDE